MYKHNLVASIFLVVALLLMTTTSALAETSGTFTVVKGDVQVTSADGKTEKAKIGRKVLPADVITAGPDSRAKIVMADKNVINISPETKIALEKYVFDPATDNKQVELNVVYGKVRATVEQKYDGEKNKFHIKTPSAVAGVRGTDFFTSYSAKNRETRIVTFEGKVAVGLPGPKGQILNPVFVTQGQMTTASKGAPPAPPVAMPAEDFKQVSTESQAEPTKQEAPKPDSAAPAKEEGSDKKDEGQKSGDTNSDSAKSEEPKAAESSKSEESQKQENAQNEPTTSTETAQKEDVRKEEGAKSESAQTEKQPEPKSGEKREERQAENAPAPEKGGNSAKDSQGDNKGSGSNTAATSSDTPANKQPQANGESKREPASVTGAAANNAPTTNAPASSSSTPTASTPTAPGIAGTPESSTPTTKVSTNQGPNSGTPGRQQPTLVRPDDLRPPTLPIMPTQPTRPIMPVVSYVPVNQTAQQQVINQVNQIIQTTNSNAKVNVILRRGTTPPPP
jgi:hypothetical protein